MWVIRRWALIANRNGGGVCAFQSSSIFVVGIPNNVTRNLGLGEAADLVVDSLAELAPEDLLARLA